MKAHSLNPLLLQLFARTHIVTTCCDSGFFVSAKWDSSGFDPFTCLYLRHGKAILIATPLGAPSGAPNASNEGQAVVGIFLC